MCTSETSVGLALFYGAHLECEFVIYCYALISDTITQNLSNMLLFENNSPS